MIAIPVRLAGLTVFALATPLFAADPPLPKMTHTFKTVGDVKIQADVYRVDDAKVRPVLVWIHGGALIMGNRKSVPQNLLDLCRDKGYALVSIDYRLAPEVKVPDIIADVTDAFRWIHGEGAKTCHFDTDRVVVTGGSAGGYLTLMTGVVVKPRPTIVAYWGYGDVDGDWYTKPSEFYRKQVPLIDKADAYKGVGGKVITGSEDGIDFKPRSRFYHYLRQNGLWTKEITGFDPAIERAKLEPYCPVRNVTAEYPPTMLVHGTEDTDVPYQLSADMDKELAKHEVPRELVTVTGAGHGLSGGDKNANADAHARAIEFIRSQMKAAKIEDAIMRIGHWQLEAKTGDFDANLAKVVAGLERADRDRVEIVCFPECFLTGYPDKEEIVRKSAFAADSPQMMKLLDKTGRFEATYIVGFNETRGADLYNTAVVIHKGHILGTYSKCSAYMKFHKQGREFPVFERGGVKFGVIICSDGGYIEPARILALKGARIIFAPHFNYIGAKGLIGHFQHVRADHIARAVENDVWFVRGNNVVLGNDAGLSYEGVGYGDSYIVDPFGEMLVRSRRHREDFIFADVDPAVNDKGWGVGRSLFSVREFGKFLLAAAERPK